jgi:deazaflavin-dependent oxidoreductase (nitroreductase family)
MPAIERPHGLTRWLADLPGIAYRLGLGWIYGRTLVELTHRGRTSGRTYRTVLEVVRSDPATREVIVVSGWGGTTDWYRNLQAAPALRIRTGRWDFVPDQRFLAPDETWSEVMRYVATHQREARAVHARLFGIDLDAPPDQVRARVDEFFRGVGFRPAAR